MQNIDTVLSEISKFPMQDKEILDEILRKRIIEEKRTLIFHDYKTAKSDYKKGGVKSGSVEDLFKSLNK